MAINNFNNNMGFPHLTKNQFGPFMTQIPVQNNSASTPVQPEVSPKVSKKEKENMNYLLGGAAIVASAIAGIYLSRGGKKTSEVVDVVKEESKKISIQQPHIKDKFFDMFGVNNEERSVDQYKEYKLYKILNKVDESGNPIKKYHGIKRVEYIEPNAYLAKTSFVDDDGNCLADVCRNSKNGEIIWYRVFNKEGKILREYDTVDSIVHKNVYDKDGNLVIKVDYDKNGWSLEQRFDANHKAIGEKIEFGVNPNSIDL